MKTLEVAKVGLTGTVASWEVINPDGSIAQACYNPKNNLILDVGLDMVGGYASIPACFAYIALGTGTSASNVLMTALEAETTYGATTRPPASGYSAYDGITLPAADADPFIVEYAIGIQTAVGKLNGTFTELGFGPTSTKDANLFSRFRICDSEGTPTSVTVTSEQQLRVKYIIGIRFLPIVPTAYDFDITGYGDDIGYTAGWQSLGYISILLYLFGTLDGFYTFGQSVQIGYWKFLVKTVTTADITFSDLITTRSYAAWAVLQVLTAGTGPTSPYYTRDAYTPGSYAQYLNIPFTTLESVGNIYGLQLFINNYTGGGNYNSVLLWLCKFDDPIVKPDTHNLTFKLKFSWGRGS